MAKLFFVLLLSLLLSACERRTEVALEGGNPPTFMLSGSGRLGEVIIFGPEQERPASSDPLDETYALWKLEPEKKGEDGAALVEQLHSLTYGVVPNGYKQTKPRIGPAPPLETGKRYRYWFVTVNAPWGAGYFEIREGKAILIKGP